MSTQSLCNAPYLTPYPPPKKSGSLPLCTPFPQPSPRHPPKKQNMASEMHTSVLLPFMHRAAEIVGVELDVPLSAAHKVADTTHITASVTTFLTTEFERDMLRSALHVTMLEECQRFAPLSVHIFVPPVVHTYENTTSASQWIRDQISGVDEWALLCAQMLGRSLLERVIDTYPWRAAEMMRAMLPAIWSESMLELGGTRPTTSQRTIFEGNVDKILPRIDEACRSSVIPNVYSMVMAAASQHLGRQPDSVLELYETVFELVVQKRHQAPLAVRLVFDRLFESPLPFPAP